MNTLGERLKATVFGESHADVIGIIIDGLPAGLNLDESLIKDRLEQRRPQADIGTPRIETDDFQIISGYYQNKTTGAPLTITIKNKNTISSDYEKLKNTPRPSHADYPAHIKYNGFNDPRGGGIFSGRMTALLVVLGAISEQLLAKTKIVIASHILSVKTVSDSPFDQFNVNNELLQSLKSSRFPVIKEEILPKMTGLIREAKLAGDSVGGVVESAIINLPIGLGEPLFNSFESRLSQLLYAIPSIKGIEFGSGFQLANMYGSEANDTYRFEENRVVTNTNHNGGVLGGITNGMPVIFRVVVKPTPSISKPQRTVDLETRKDETITVDGRHDPAIIARIAPVINAVIAFGVVDFLYQYHEKDWLK
jgi:chorismate synthase